MTLSIGVASFPEDADDAEAIIRAARPRLAILTHFGMTMWRAHPWELAARLTESTGIEVKAARDGMTIEL